MALSFPERFSNVNEKTKLLVFFLVYTAVGEAGFLFFTPEIGLTTFWPSCGVLAGMLLIVSPRSWAPYLVAAVASSIISSVVHAISFPLSCAIISTRTLEACLAAMIIRSTRGGGPEEAENSRNVLTLIIASVVSSGVVSFLVVLAEAGFSPASRWSLWPIWWTGDAVAIMAIAPAFVFSGKLSLSTPRRGRILVIGESVALFITAGIVAWFGFLAQIPLFVNARAFLVLPVLWAALRRPPLYTAMVGILLVMCAMWGIAQHPDPAAGGDAVLALSMLSHLGLFTILIGFGLYVSVVVCEKNARESRLTESERQNHLLADNASEMVVRFAPDGKVTFVSPASNRILGYDSRQLSEDGFLKSLVHPEDLPVVVAAADAVTSLHEPAVFRVRVRKPDASYCWTETTVCAVRHNESGVVSEIHAVTRDVTIQRAAESELAKLNRALQTTIECNQILVRAGSEDDLLHGVGNIIVDQGHYPLIWVALLDGDCVKEVLLNSSPAHKEVLTGDVRTIWTETLLGNGPAGLALSNGKMVLVNEIGQERTLDRLAGMATHCNCTSLVALPLVTGEKSIGVVVIGSEDPKGFDSREIGLLVGLVDDLTFGIVALREKKQRSAAESALRESEQRLSLLFREVPTIITISQLRSDTYIEVNEAFARVIGLRRDEIVGKTPTEIGLLQDEGERKAFLDEVQRMGEVRGREQRYTMRDGAVMDCLVSSVVMPTGDAPCLLSVVSDITAWKASEAQLNATLHEKDILIREIHHRVKNNMQVISSLLSLQAEEAHDPRTMAFLQASRNRVKSMALIHEKLYGSPDLALVDFESYARDLTDHLLNVAKKVNIDVEICMDDIPLAIDRAIPCGLILNELMTNSLRHAFPRGREGKITISLKQHSADMLLLVIEDNGVGVARGKDFHSVASLGLQLVDLLCRQLRGNFSFSCDSGTRCEVEFPINA